LKDVFHELEAYEIKTGNIHTFSAKECAFGYRESVFKRALKNQFVITSVTFKLTKKPSISTHYGAIQAQLNEMGITHPTIKNVSDAVIAIRQSKLPDPKQVGNAGSFFKNPVISVAKVRELQEKYPSIPVYEIDESVSKIPAGWLIEQAGWKGKTMGNFGVHKNQALVLVNYGGADGNSIEQLSREIMDSILEKFGVQLEREVNII
jgi:UDP-N-acetylmuramate dehydrogenase